MKVGDLVKLKGVHHPNRRRLGIVVGGETVMVRTKRVGMFHILWNDGTTARATYSNLEVIA